MKHPINAGVSQGSILGPILFLLDLPNGVICSIATYADDTTLYTLNVMRHLICGNN